MKVTNFLPLASPPVLLLLRFQSTWGGHRKKRSLVPGRAKPLLTLCKDRKEAQLPTLIGSHTSPTWTKSSPFRSSSLISTTITPITTCPPNGCKPTEPFE